jgi:hypothetical protein
MRQHQKTDPNSFLQIAEEHIQQIFHRFDWERAASAFIQEEQRRLLERRL